MQRQRRGLNPPVSIGRKTIRKWWLFNGRDPATDGYHPKANPKANSPSDASSLAP